MILTIASGKGGTGKTTIATSLALAATEPVVLLRDCDVEAPNAHLFLRPHLNPVQPVNIPIPQVDPELCTTCGKCVEVCQYHALLLLSGRVITFAELCHGCGSCLLNCPEKAIQEVPFPIGETQTGSIGERLMFIHGRLQIGQPMAVPIIRAIKRWQPASRPDIEIRDAPPGASCPVVATLQASDFVLLVTEPTPFGLHDLRLAVELVRELRLPAGVVINRAGLLDEAVEQFCGEAGLPVLLRIPLRRQYAAALAEGQPLITAFPEFRPQFERLYREISALLADIAPVVHP